MGDVVPFKKPADKSTDKSKPMPVGPGQSGMAPGSAWDRLLKDPKAAADAIRAAGDNVIGAANDPVNPAPRPMPNPSPSQWKPGQPWPRDPNAPA